MKSARRESLTALVFLLPSLLGMTIFVFIPLVWSFVMSFTDWSLISSPKFVGFKNFSKLFVTDPTFWTSVTNTLWFTVEFVVLNIALALAIATWISAQKWGKAALRVIFFIPVFTPAIAVSIVWLLILSSGGVFDSISVMLGFGKIDMLNNPRLAMHAVVIVSLWANVGYNVVLLNASLDLVPKTYLEAARIDGAGAWRRFWDVRVPMISPTIFFACVMTAINGLQVFDQIYVLTRGGPGSSTVTLGYSIFQHGFERYDMGYAAAVSWVMFSLIFALTMFQFRMQRKWVHYDS